MNKTYELNDVIVDSKGRYYVVVGTEDKGDHQLLSLNTNGDSRQLSSVSIGYTRIYDLYYYYIGNLSNPEVAHRVPNDLVPEEYRTELVSRISTVKPRIDYGARISKPRVAYQ